MGIAERKQRDYDRRRALILSAARRAFRRRGFAGVTLDDIALKIEFSKGTIYSHFQSKEEIFAQILVGHLDRLIEVLKKAAAASVSTEDGIRRALEAYLRFYDQHRDYGQLLFFVDAHDNREHIPDRVKKEIHRRKLACLRELQRILAGPERTESKARSAAAKDLALLLWGMLNGILQLHESRQIERAELGHMIDLGFGVVMNGLPNIFNPKT